MAIKWFYKEDFIVMKFYLDNETSWQKNLHIVMNELDSNGFGARTKKSVIARIGNYKYLHTGSGLSHVADQTRFMYSAWKSIMTKPHVYSSIRATVASTYVPRPAETPELRMASERFELITVSPKSLAPSFAVVLFKLIDKHAFAKDSEVYKAAQVKRDVFSAIKCGKNKGVSKRTVMQLCIGAKLTYEEAVELMESAGYAFAKNNLTDVIVAECLKQGIYDIFEVNESLYESGATLLFGEEQ
ncbi:MAG: hypothetical protein IJ309_04290 [Clostridia bacterium]|nr:hypothetical protein [Clostridia bacterium]